MNEDTIYNLSYLKTETKKTLIEMAIVHGAICAIYAVAAMILHKR